MLSADSLLNLDCCSPVALSASTADPSMHFHYPFHMIYGVIVNRHENNFKKVTWNMSDHSITWSDIVCGWSDTIIYSFAGMKIIFKKWPEICQITALLDLTLCVVDLTQLYIALQLHFYHWFVSYTRAIFYLFYR